MPPLPPNWRDRARPIAPGRPYPAQEHCSQCGLCDTYYVAQVKTACAFLGEGMRRIESLEAPVHGRSRLGQQTSLKAGKSDPERHFGVTQGLYYGRVRQPVAGAQWTGVVTTIAVELLRQGYVDGVVCVQSAPGDRFQPQPILATTVEEVLAARGVKPTLSPNLNILAELEQSGLKKILFCGVGCQVQALRSIAPDLGLDQLYVIGTHCVDNGRRSGLDQFLKTASTSPETVQHYEFMQDYQVHFKHRIPQNPPQPPESGQNPELNTFQEYYEQVPYFCLPSAELTTVIAPSCYSCFDYMNGLADLVVGYMGVPYQNQPMSQHLQQILVRNDRGQALLDLVKPLLELQAPQSRGDRRTFVLQTLIQEEQAKAAPKPPKPLPRWAGKLLAWILTRIGPQGLEFARYSIDYHTLRNYLYVQRHRGPAGIAQIPDYARAIVAEYANDPSFAQFLDNQSR
ncbi:MAG: coenzyme F420 hydrogenase/dehydrogenase beta subunit N-terminal domain-containing protein [Prochlorothrix sp.]|nr:coenzyme F420 hydrogenase/dehydrogenase beta subunit N-terminal domain-containing protein [Prochlorothrix sp.]